jgi:hypothetical protein
MSASMLFNSICIKDMIGICRHGFNPQYRQIFSLGIFQDLSTLTDFNWIVLMVKSDLMDTYTITDSRCGSKSEWPLPTANRSNVYVSGKNDKILLIPETMQSISTIAESKAERSKKKQKKKTIPMWMGNDHLIEFHLTFSVDQNFLIIWAFD